MCELVNCHPGLVGIEWRYIVVVVVVVIVVVILAVAVMVTLLPPHVTPHYWYLTYCTLHS